MTVTRKELTNMLEQAEEAEQSATRLAGSLDQINKQLETEFGVKTIKQAKTKLDALDSEVETLDEEIEKETAKLKEEFKLL